MELERLELDLELESFASLAAVLSLLFVFFFQAEDGIRDRTVTGVQTCALPISYSRPRDPSPASAVHGSSRRGGRSARSSRRKACGRPRALSGAALRGLSPLPALDRKSVV